jgi:hypothetical protein
VDLKEGKKEYDEMWKYARDSLVHYARWMAENENPYLDQKDKLEYPNETWACQDLRKCHILLYVANYVEYSLGITFIKKAENFYSKAMRQLNGFTSKNLTRPIVLLMLNDHLFKEGQSIHYSTAFSSPIKTDKKLNMNLDKKRNKYSKRFLNKVLSLSIRHEYSYIYWKFWRRFFGG